MRYIGEISWEDFQASRDFIEEKALAMMSHRKKDAVKVGFPLQNYTILALKDRRFYLIKSNVFKVLVDSLIIETIEKKPDNFGTKNADDVINAIYEMEPVGTLSSFPSFLQEEQFCYIIENDKGKFEKILRIDLFGKLHQTQNRTEFIGGLLHALKHFAYQGKPLSTHDGGHEIININSLLAQIGTAFFTIPLIHQEKRNFLIYVPLNDKYQLRMSIYYEKETDMYYLNTVFKERVKRKSQYLIGENNKRHC